MSKPIEDYALIGDCQTGALVARDGSIDWLCLPRFDSPACFAALLGQREHGRWQLRPAGEIQAVRRRYLGDSLVLETEFQTAAGTVALIDFMPPRSEELDLVRLVIGRQGRVPLQLDLVLRFDYGSAVPWVRQKDHALHAVAGPDAVVLRTPVALRGENLHTVADFSVQAGERVPFVLAWHPSHLPPPAARDAEELLRSTTSWWAEWAARCTYRGEWREAVLRSLITLKALTYAPTGGLVAALTTSLPEQIGGPRNWDYRFCWLRDATFTLYALMEAGYLDEAAAWRDWLVRAVAGQGQQIQPLYGVAGERRLVELELDHLPGYAGSRPVRIGNGAYSQVQLDVVGELMDTLHVARGHGLPPDEDAWGIQRQLLQYLEGSWQLPDEGIWEIRGRRQHFTHSKVMAWVAADRAVKGVERYGLPGPVARWRALREQIHQDVCQRGFDPQLGSFVQAYGSKELDASLLMLPLVGFLPARDPRILGTIAAIQRQLLQDGLVLRYRSESGVDGLPPGEAPFLLCSFWLADALELAGRHEEALRLFERLLALRNDVGLLPEEVEPLSGRFLGNYPQAFSHIALVNSAKNLSPSVPPEQSPAQERPHEGERGE